MYKFEKCDPQKLPQDRSLICNIYSEETGKKHSLFIGQVMKLFGNPDYMTDNYEDAFSCAVTAKENNGKILYLEIYHGSSGPAISGARNDDTRKAAQALTQIIMESEAVDYEKEFLYEDIPVKIKMGVKNGVPYYDSEFPEEFL
ncbi:MAG: hypothetical protein HFJ09_07985 [Lachnospiraceae bacterium]|nr:hypothetical protein [Lachnospiraceae bacterium]